MIPNVYLLGTNQRAKGGTLVGDLRGNHTQRVHLYYYYRIRYPKTILNRVFGVPNSINSTTNRPSGIYRNRAADS